MAKKNADGKSMTQKELATAVNAKPQDVSIAVATSGVTREAGETIFGSEMSDSASVSYLVTPGPDLSLHHTRNLRIADKKQIADLEAGRAAPNQQLLAKLERIVGVKLRGAANQIGQPLHGPKKK